MNVKCIENFIVVFDHISIDGTPSNHYCTSRIQTHDHSDHMVNFFSSYSRLKHTILSQATYKMIKRITNPKKAQGLDIRPNIKKLKYEETFSFEEDRETYEITLYKNAHILGSAMCLIKKISTNESVIYSSDLGPLIIQKKLKIPKADTVIIDGTVGNVNPDFQKDWDTSIEMLVDKFSEISNQDRAFQFCARRGTIEKVMQVMADKFPNIPVLVSKVLQRTLNIYNEEGFQITNPLKCISDVDLTEIPKYLYFCTTQDDNIEVHCEKPILFTLSGFELGNSKEYIKEDPDNENHYNCFVTAHASYQTYIEFILQTEAKNVIIDNSRTNSNLEKTLKAFKEEGALENINIKLLKD